MIGHYRYKMSRQTRTADSIYPVERPPVLLQFRDYLS
jgi:hypothetical protein